MGAKTVNSIALQNAQLGFRVFDDDCRAVDEDLRHAGHDVAGGAGELSGEI